MTPARIYPKVFTCQYCKKEYTHRHGTVHGEVRKFCSQKCGNAFRGTTKPVIKCLQCNNTFYARASKRSETGRQVFCSKKCRWEYQRKTSQAITTFTCKRCGKQFNKQRSSHRVYCSASCANNIKKHTNARFTRLKTKTWEEIRKEVISRDNHACRICGGINQLIVHHITAWVITKDDSPKNLITLCRSCHHKVEWSGFPLP